MRRLVLAMALALACGGCGAAPPQPPAVHANRIASALSGIGEACGEAYQRGSPSAGAQASANERVLELARAYRAGPQWVYQGRTLTRVVAEAVHYLRECGLHGAAARLVALTR